MSDLIALTFDNELRAEEVRLALIKADQEYAVEIEDAVVAVRKPNGTIKLRQMHHLTTGGAVGGGFWGALIGLIFLNPLLGAAVGAGTGAIVGALTDIGINDDFIRELASGLPPEGSALFILVRDATKDRFVERLRPYGGQLLHTSLNHADEDRLRQALGQAQA